MSLCMEIQVASSSEDQQHELLNRVRDAVRNLGFSIDESTYTPEAAVLAELAAVETSRATVKTYEA